MQNTPGRSGFGAPQKALGMSGGGRGVWVLASVGEDRAGRALWLSGDFGFDAE